MIDLPRAATLLAQGAGRLIRNGTDRGVVAVLDPRLATARSYRWELINALPPMTRTKERDDVVRFLQQLRDDEVDPQSSSATDSGRRCQFLTFTNNSTKAPSALTPSAVPAFLRFSPPS